mmetsp:Transcript_42510/g.52329  ORF Transcript_42510/g.52329 Transcript_42510/m.52329 type:complete len:210 (-) Transcript_42510:712-1341(-)
MLSLEKPLMLTEPPFLSTPPSSTLLSPTRPLKESMCALSRSPIPPSPTARRTAGPSSCSTLVVSRTSPLSRESETLSVSTALFSDCTREESNSTLPSTSTLPGLSSPLTRRTPKARIVVMLRPLPTTESTALSRSTRRTLSLRSASSLRPTSLLTTCSPPTCTSPSLRLPLRRTTSTFSPRFSRFSRRTSSPTNSRSVMAPTRPGTCLL